MHGAGAAQAMTADEFFARARARLTLDVPAGIDRSEPSRRRAATTTPIR